MKYDAPEVNADNQDYWAWCRRSGLYEQALARYLTESFLPRFPKSAVLLLVRSRGNELGAAAWENYRSPDFEAWFAGLRTH